MRFVACLSLFICLSLASACGGHAMAPAGLPLVASPVSTAASGTGRLFPSANANWLYSAPSGAALNVSGMAAGMKLQLNTHNAGFDYPVQYADGSQGCTEFTDTAIYAYHDDICVPTPAGGFQPSYGGWGADDGHLVVVDRASGAYYDFWKLYTDGNGHPTSTNVGQIVSGSLGGNGTPGTTAAAITGLAGDILPGELDCDTCLRHALNVVVPGASNSPQVGTQAPAAKTDGQAAGAVFREGAKLRLDPAVDVDSLNASTAAKAILHALQDYGAVITDQTGGDAIGLYSALATAPDLSGLQQALPHLWIYY
ncbi:MAG: hypothetical protein ACRD1A_05895 [Terriglobales bacterium]